MGTEITISGLGNDAFDRALRQAKEQVMDVTPGFSYAATTTYNPETSEAIRIIRLEAARSDAMGELMAQISKLTPELQNEMRGRIAALSDVQDIRDIAKVKNAIAADIQRAAEWSATEVSLNDQQSREEQIKQIWDNIDRLNKDIQHALQDANKGGCLTDEELKKSQAEQAAIEAHKVSIAKMADGPEKEEENKKLAKEIIEHAQNDRKRIEHAIEEAEKMGNYGLANDLRQALPKTDEIQERVEKLKQLQAQSKVVRADYDLQQQSALGNTEKNSDLDLLTSPNKPLNANVLAALPPLTENISLADLPPPPSTPAVPSESKGGRSLG